MERKFPGGLNLDSVNLSFQYWLVFHSDHNIITSFTTSNIMSCFGPSPHELDLEDEVKALKLEVNVNGNVNGMEWKGRQDQFVGESREGAH